MGIQQQVDGILKKVRKDNTTNPRLGREVSKRAKTIAATLEGKGDTTKEAQLVKILKGVEQPFAVTAGNNAKDRIDPRAFSLRKNVLFEAINQFDELEEGPAESRKAALQAADQEDKKQFSAEFTRLVKEAKGSMVKVLEVLPARQTGMERFKDVEMDADVSGLVEIAEKVFQKLDAMAQEGLITAMTTLHLFNLESPDGDPFVCVVPSDSSYTELAERFMAENEEMSAPFFYIRKDDAKGNVVTNSGRWWELQDESASVSGTKAKGPGTETKTVDIVLRDGEYVIALLNDQGVEKGVAVDMPKRGLTPVYDHLSHLWPDRTIVKVCKLANGCDAKEEKFNRVRFKPYSNPLYVELGPGERMIRKAETV